MDSVIYKIRVRGHLDEQWRGWFEHMGVTLDEDGTTILTGPLADQAALFGVLKKIRNLGLPLLSIEQVPDK